MNSDILRSNISKLISSRQHEQRAWIIPSSPRITQQMLVWRSSEWNCLMAVGDNDNTILVLFSEYQQSIFKFDKAIDISSQPRGQNFPLLRPKLLYIGACISTNTWLLKSPKMRDNDYKLSNHRLMTVLCRTKTTFTDFRKPSKQ